MVPALNHPSFRTMCAAIVLCGSSTNTTAQLSSNCAGFGDNGNFSIVIDTIATNIGVINDAAGGITDLTGYNTYQLFLQCESSNDLLQAVGGDSINPVTIQSTTSFYQAAFGTAIEPNSSLFAPFPQVQYDSFVTIGLEAAAISENGEASTQVIEGASSPISGAFENGQDLIINSFTGSSWYIADAELATNCTAGDDLRVLFAQVTTDGNISGNVQFQVYRNGTQNSANCLRPYLNFLDGGCLDPLACNYDTMVSFDDGSCNYCNCPDTTEVTSVSFPSDSVPGYSLDIELIAKHDTSYIPELNDMKTYRMYVAMAEPNDTLTAVYGNDQTPLDIQSTSSFFHSWLGGVTPSSIQTLFYDFDPTVVYDSWVTIGIDKLPSEFGTGYSSIFTASDPNVGSSWMADFDPGGGAAGGNIMANTNVGGIWSITNPTVQNGIPNGDQRVLIGQFTTSGVISGSIAAQVLPQTLPAGDDEYRLTFSFTTEALGIPNQNSNPLCNCGSIPDVDGDGICDDVDNCIGLYDYCGVCNGPGPIYDCGCIEQPVGACNCQGDTLDVLGICGGSCEADLDGDGVCDVDEVFGCTDALACNFVAIATEEDGSCQYLDVVGVCGGDCTSDLNDNGICDTEDALHCGPGTVWDFETALCVVECPSDLNSDGAVAIGDLLILLSDFANFCEDLE